MRSWTRSATWPSSSRRSADHPNLGGFLAWLEAADSRENGLDMPVSEPDPDAVQLITVHAAKGLEWDVVAVAGLVDGGLPATATQGKDGPKDSAWLTGLGSLPYPLRGDRHDLPVFAYAGAEDPKELEERRKQFVLDAGDHQVAEERRLAYVALTRARSDLLLTAAWWGDGTRVRKVSVFLTELAEAGLVETGGWEEAPDAAGTNPRASLVLSATWPADPFGAEAASTRRPHVEDAAARVREAMAVRGSADDLDRRHEHLGRRRGSLRHHGAARRPSADVPAAHPWDVLADRLLAERERVRRPSGEVELPAHLSASALVRLESDPGEFAQHLRRPVPAEPSPQARRGTRFHAWVEGWYGSASLVDVDALPGADDDSATLDLDEQALRDAFLATEWANRSPVAVEVDIEISVDGYVLRSRIDAVFPDPQRGQRAARRGGRRLEDRRTAEGRGGPGLPRAPAGRLPARVVALDRHPARPGARRVLLRRRRCDRVPGAAARRGRDHRPAALGDAGTRPAGRRRGRTEAQPARIEDERARRPPPGVGGREGRSAAPDGTTGRPHALRRRLSSPQGAVRRSRGPRGGRGAGAPSPGRWTSRTVRAVAGRPPRLSRGAAPSRGELVVGHAVPVRYPATSRSARNARRCPVTTASRAASSSSVRPVSSPRPASA